MYQMAFYFDILGSLVGCFYYLACVSRITHFIRKIWLFSMRMTTVTPANCRRTLCPAREAVAHDIMADNGAGTLGDTECQPRWRYYNVIVPL